MSWRGRRNAWEERLIRGDRSPDQRSLGDPIPFFVKYAYDVIEGKYRCPKCKGTIISIHESGNPMFCGRHTGRMTCPESRDTYVEGKGGKPIKGKIISGYPRPEVISGCGYLGDPKEFGAVDPEGTLKMFFNPEKTAKAYGKKPT